MDRRGVLAAIPAALAAGCASAPPRTKAAIDPLAYIDPELRDAAARLLTPEGRLPPLNDAALAAIRNGGAGASEPLLAGVPVFERQIRGPEGAPDVAIHVVNARAGASRPAVLHMHGGGFVLGAARRELRFLQDVAHELDCVVVSVEYRLAPETRFSGSVEDNYAALLWTHRNAREIGVDPARIAVMGESAGGGHAALLAIAARDRGDVPLVLQVLIYPMLDDRTGSVVHPPPSVGGVLWTAEHNVYGWRSFLGAEPGGRNVPAAGVPARTRRLEGLPPAFIAVGSADLFVDEDIAYARRLIDAGVETELLVVPGAFHAFDRIAAGTSVSRRFWQARMNALRRAFGIPAAA